jgi:hypothetical protein
VRLFGKSMYRLEYNLDEDPVNDRKASIVITSTQVLLGTADDSDILLEADFNCRVTISEARNGQVTIRDLNDHPSILIDEEHKVVAELKDRDLVRIGNAEFRFIQIVPPQTLVSRSRSLLEKCSTAAVWGVMAAQVVFIAWVLVFWRIGGLDVTAASGPDDPPVEMAQVSLDPGEPTAADPLRSPARPRTPEPIPEPTPVPEPVVPEPEPIVPEPEPIVPEPEPIVPEPEPVAPTPLAPSSAPEAVAPTIGAQVVMKNNEPSILPAALREPDASPRPSAQVNPDAREIPRIPEIDQTPQVVEKKPQIMLEENLLDSAIKQASLGNFTRADVYLEQIQRIDEKFLPAYAERGRLFEKRKMYPDAIKQWRELAARGENTAWQDIANREVDRLQKLDALQSYSKNIEPAIVPQSVPQGGALLEIETAVVKRLGSGENYDDMRILNLELRASSRVKELSGKDIRIHIRFFDQDRKTRQTVPTEVPTPNTDFTLTGLMSNRDPITVTRPYIVPKDFRRKQFERDGSLMTYYGFTVEIYLRGQLQERLAQPITLISKA